MLARLSWVNDALTLHVSPQDGMITTDEFKVNPIYSRFMGNILLMFAVKCSTSAIRKQLGKRVSAKSTATFPKWVFNPNV